MTFEGEGCPPVIRGSRLRRAAKIVVPAGAALGAGAAIAAAAIPSADGTISACYQADGGGSVRFVDAAGNCSTNETSITWNQKGPAGAQGPAGRAGAAGPAGPAGPAGSGAVG